MSTSFAELGIPIPLFEAPVSEARSYLGQATCSLCGRHPVHCFRLGNGAHVLVLCPACSATNALDAHKPAGVTCRTCATPIAFPALLGQPPLACYACVRAGKVVFTHDTVLGMVGWEEAVAGQTGAVAEPAAGMAWVSDGQHIVDTTRVQAINPYGVERVLTVREPALADGELMDWYASRVPREHLFELLRTPRLGLPRFRGSCEELVKEERHPCGMGGLFHPVMEVLHAHSDLGAKS